MNRNVLYAVIGALAVVVMVLGYMYYQEQQKPSGVEIRIGEGGVSIESN
jgi:RsiW-degrading membrane proteinase PrsW (M82 family)